MIPIFSTLRANSLSLFTNPRGHSILLLPRNPARTVRLYTHPTGQPEHTKSTSNPRKPKKHSPTPANARHEVHEGTETLNVPFNPPGGGPTGPGGGFSFSFTKFPLFDALLTTFIGLGAGILPLAQPI